MVIKRIGFIPSSSLYGVLGIFTKQLAAALCEIKELETCIFDLNKTAHAFFQDVYAFKPDVLVVFNSLFAQPDGQLFCDYIKIPTLFYLVDAPYQFNEPTPTFASVACIDRGHLSYLKSTGFKKAIFLPHAVDRADHFPTDKKRTYGCVMFSSGINYQTNYGRFLGALPPDVLERVEGAYEKMLSDPVIPLHEALGDNVPGPVPISLLLKEMDLFWKGKSRVDLLKDMEGITIDLFGGGDSWHEILGDSCPHVRIHGALDYKEVLQVMSQSKVVLSNCSSIRDGAHERLFTAISCGATAATQWNPYLEEQFKPGEGILLAKDNQELKSQIQNLLNDESYRQTSVEKGRKIVADKHLWINRAKELYDALNRFYV